MNHLDNYEMMIIHFLGNRGPSNTNQVADGLKISWATADKKLKALYEKGYLLKKENIWALRFK
jgi:Mn-dependent DtxR family transcriptional regulator